MKTYFDSSALVKIYINEPNSTRARQEVVAARQVPLTWLHRLEIENSIRVLVGCASLSREEADTHIGDFEDDRHAQRLAEVAPDWPKVFHEAVQLSRRHSVMLLCRSLDVLHVAIAMEIGCKTFVSADHRQLALAKAIGLSPVDIRV